MDVWATESHLSRTKVFFIAFLVWVAIYLPALGTHELRGEEGRRVLPAVTMLKTGDWLLPRVGGEVYYRKPPMINWLVGASFILTGEHNERAARLPSVLFTLAFVVLLIWLPDVGSHKSRAADLGAQAPPVWPSLKARLIAVLLFLTSAAVIEKGRQIEIEGVYIAMTSMAILSWLVLWANHCGWEETGANPPSAISHPPSAWSGWALWLVPSVFLTFGMLTKGPAILVFFYASVIAILAYSHRLRALISLPHLLSIVLWLGIPGLWMYVASVRAASASARLPIAEEVLWRVVSTELSAGWKPWLRNFGKSFTNLLPWGLFLPLLWHRGFVSPIPPARLPLLKGARLGMVISFLGISLIPGNSARYGLPILGLMSILIGWVLAEVGELPDRGRMWRGGLLVCFGLAALTGAVGFVGARMDLWGAVLLCVAVCLVVLFIREQPAFHTPVHLSMLSAVVATVLTLQYVYFTMPLTQKGESQRPTAAKLNALVPDGETIYVLRPGYQLFLFYLREPMEYLLEPGQVDGRVRFLLVRKDAYPTLFDEPALALRQPKTLYTFAAHKADYQLVELSPAQASAGIREGG
jgi:4-amino-4-deoxy-L-arabinose transferase-like glycosyltransferase